MQNIFSSTLNSSSFSNITYTGSCSRNSLSTLTWTVIAAICVLLGFPAGLMMLQQLLQRRRLSSDFFMFNLFFTDSIFLFVVPVDIFNSYFWHHVQFEWIENFLDGLSVCNRPLFMACTCVDCYFAVVHPVMYMTNRNFTMIRRFTSVMIWLITICFSLLKCLVVWESKHIFNAVPLFIALPVIAFCHTTVLQALKKTVPSGNRNIHPQKKQALHTIINSFIMTFFAYLPPVISFSLVRLVPETQKCIVETIGFSFSMTGCVIMPVLYLHGVGKLQILNKLWRKCI